MIEASDWNPLQENSEIFSFPAIYNSSNLEFQANYLHESTFQNLSRRYFYRGRVVAESIASLSEYPKGGCKIDAWGLPATLEISSGLSANIYNFLEKKIRQELEEIIEQYSPNEVNTRDALINGIINPLTRSMLNLGAESNNIFFQEIDLHMQVDLLKSSLRKSYKSLINKGVKNFDISIYDSTTILPEHMEEFRILHKDVSGRSTRSIETWKVQLEAIRREQAFIIFVRFNNDLIGASYFMLNKSQCLYGVGAYKRELFHLPISHASIWTAVLHAKSLGCSSFLLGEVFFSKPSQMSEKELSIAKFKRGFGGTTTPELRLSHIANIYNEKKA